MEKKVYSYMYQAIVISVVMIISKLIEGVLPFVMPASVIGLILLFTALCTNVIKLEQVEPVGYMLVDNISLLFVPAGISVINSFNILSQHPILILGLIIISTFLLLAFTGWIAQLILKVNPKSFKVSFPEKTPQSEGVN
ncbi:antiholin-like murein hydrolase modulator LrgA [Metaclostridioides mangenotii]|uniref:antiholin-like murein hydrolase modulator LrgA n=1 Tax=Metaclostridioides mangenotii TaxID=1540 RepID=UPI00046572D8|nr:antiholin-like murein hydrolase modulator LrgA [Clostridioides mangenotii]